MEKRVEHIGDYTATIEVLPPGQAKLCWHHNDGKLLKSLPKAISERHRSEYNNIKSKLKNIKDTLRAQTRRIESFYLEGFKTSIDEWWRYYVEHPLINSISSSLIWNFDDDGKIYSATLENKNLIMADGSFLDDLSNKTLVSLWHPVLADVNTRTAWRNYIWKNAISQPFRQAFREVYVECLGKNSPLSVNGLYVRQNQFRALLLSKGWRYQLRGSFDSDCLPELYLKEETICQIDITGESKSTSGAGIFLAVELGDIQFLRKGKLLSRSGLRPIEYSEVMRDIDLFTSISGLGYKQDWDQVEDTVADLKGSIIFEKMSKINGQASVICNDLISDNTSLKDVLIKFLCTLETSMQKFPIPETVKTRAVLLDLMLQTSEIADQINIEGRYINVASADGDGGYRINLASGLVFSASDNRLIPVPDNLKIIENESGKDTLLSRIYSLVLMLARD